MTNHFAADHFSKKVVKSLNKAGIYFVGMQACPDEFGSFLNSITGYCLSNGQIKTYTEILGMVA